LQAQAYARHFLDESALLDGRATEVHAGVMPLLDRLRDVPEFGYYLDPIAAWALLDSGRKQQAADIVEACIASMRTRSRNLFLTQALRVRAMLAIHSCSWEAAKADLDEAITLARAMPYPYAELKARYVYGQMEAARGDPSAAHERFEQALAIC